MKFKKKIILREKYKDEIWKELLYVKNAKMKF
jgi:hypothetical protein